MQFFTILPEVPYIPTTYIAYKIILNRVPHLVGLTNVIIEVIIYVSHFTFGFIT